MSGASLDFIQFDLKKKLQSALGPMNLSVQGEISKGEFLILKGESGAGKTTVLRMLAGLSMPDAGQVSVFGKNWFDHSRKISLSIQKREVGFVFQDDTLFPNMTVWENLIYAGGKTEKAWAFELIELMALGELKDQKPSFLSGGQKQRAALARALMRRPKLLFLDEPFSALNIQIRRRLQKELYEIHKKFGLTTLLVSHDYAEIFQLADKVLWLERGKVKAFGAVHEVLGIAPFEWKEGTPVQILRVEEGAAKSVRLTVLAGERIQSLDLAGEDVSDLKALKVGETVLFK